MDAAREVISAAVKAGKTVRSEDHPVQIFAQEFAASSINFKMTWWTESAQLDVRTSRDAVISAVRRALEVAGIGIPFPCRNLTFKEPLPLARGAAAANEREPEAADLGD
ncbi:mechanosensitive ion channel family protein [Loktanella sp. M215]|uniref:mechanosensitive ion channel family protein n=1 Tax=Loktanella sp. M215 TaxID=2675431 RepID=UPI001F278A44|nr:mechanosensitive ion channel family protein [Loktanella sp. M215]MCF7699982.1 hypothetical protein [Loktanella sp. M215]